MNIHLVNKDYERDLLRIILSDLEKPELVIDNLSADLFTGIERDAFLVAQSLCNNGSPVNLLTMRHLAFVENNKTPVTALYLAELTGGLLVTTNWRHYRETLESCRIERAKIEIKRSFIEEFEKDGIDFAVSQLIGRIAELNETTKPAHVLLGDAAVSLFDEIMTVVSSGKQPPRTPTGLFHVDRILGGFKPCELILLGGRPAMGKTALALQFALNQATKKHPVAFFSLEMSEAQLTGRALSNLLDFDGKLLNDYLQMSSQQIEFIRENYWRLNIPLHVFDLDYADLPTIEAHLSRLIREKKIVGAYIDYLQLIRPYSSDRAKSKYEQITAISIGLKNMAKRLGIWVCVVSSLSRGVDGRPDKRPLMSDLRESGQLEYDADKIIFVFRPAEYMPIEEAPQFINYLEIIIRKHRSGALGNILTHVDLSRTRVTDWDELQSKDYF